MIPGSNQAAQIKDDIKNNERTLYQPLGEVVTKRNQQSDTKETKQFWSKTWKQKKYK